MKKYLLTLFIFLTSLFTLKAQNIYTIAGNGEIGYSGDGFLSNSNYCEMYQPAGIYIDKFGNIYISDASNNVIRKISTDGIISTFAGVRISGYGGYSGDGGPAISAELNIPQGICGDTLGNIFIADYDNGVIRKVNTSGIITTVAGTGKRGFSGDGGPARNAELNFPVYVYVDIHENMYISDLGNFRVRKVDASGIISTIAGNGMAGDSGDGGPATAAKILEPLGLISDLTGNIYIAMSGYSVIRKINTLGIISTIAGNGTDGYSGDGGLATSAELNYPIGLCFDTSGNILFCDGGNSRIRKIDPSGIISTIAGSEHAGYTGDGGIATDAELYGPWGISLNQYGNVCFTDQGNNVVRILADKPFPLGLNTIGNKMDINIYPNPTNQKLNLRFNRQIKGFATLAVMDVTGREVFNSQLAIDNSQLVVDVSTLSSGMYFLTIKSNDNSVTQKFIKY